MLYINQIYEKENEIIKTQIMQLVLEKRHEPFCGILRNALRDLELKMANIDVSKTPEELSKIYIPLAYAKQDVNEILGFFEKVEQDNQFINPA